MWIHHLAFQLLHLSIMLSYLLIFHDAEKCSVCCSKCVIKCSNILDHNQLLSCLINILFPLRLGSAMEVAGGGISRGLISPHFLLRPQM